MGSTIVDREATLNEEEMKDVDVDVEELQVNSNIQVEIVGKDVNNIIANVPSVQTNDKSVTHDADVNRVRVHTEVQDIANIENNVVVKTMDDNAGSKTVDDNITIPSLVLFIQLIRMTRLNLKMD